MTELGAISRLFFRLLTFCRDLAGNRAAYRRPYYFGFRLELVFRFRGLDGLRHHPPDRLRCRMSEGPYRTLHCHFHRGLDFRFSYLGCCRLSYGGVILIITGRYDRASYRFCDLPDLGLGPPLGHHNFRFGHGLWFLLRDPVRREDTFDRGLSLVILDRLPGRVELLPHGGFYRPDRSRRFFFILLRFLFGGFWFSRLFHGRFPGFFRGFCFLQQGNPFIDFTGSVCTVLSKDQFHGLDLIVGRTDGKNKNGIGIL